MAIDMSVSKTKYAFRLSKKGESFQIMSRGIKKRCESTRNMYFLISILNGLCGTFLVLGFQDHIFLDATISLTIIWYGEAI